MSATPATLPDQALAREHELSAALQALVEERTREVQRLRIEIKHLRQGEADLRAALDRARVAAAARAPVAPSEASAADTTAQTPADTGGATNFTPAPATVGQTAHDIEHQHVVEIAHLQKALAAEQQRRHQVETELSRLQQETSSPPYGTPHPGEAELTAAKRQVTELRTALDQERAARERLAAEFRALQQRADAESTDIQSASTENAELRSQLKQLEEDKQKITESFNHSLAESEQRAAELERQLAQAHSTEGPNAASDGEINDIRAENSALRARLDEEHRRTEDLAAKLKTAIRVTDLIFKMRAQSAAPASRQPQIRNRPAGR